MMNNQGKKVALLILDGLGYGTKDPSNAVLAAETPYIDHLLANCPHSSLVASGEAVGLPEGQMGNSEVGHMNLGAGRIVYQELGRIHKAVNEGMFDTNETLQRAFQYALANDKQVHFIGLLSDGGVHAHTKHLKGLCNAAENAGLTDGKVFVHAFLDGRDTDPQSGIGYIRDIEQYMGTHVGKLASVIGRYYAMDRDNRWERIKLAYDLLVHGQGTATNDIEQAVRQSYDDGITDEFVKPIVRTNTQGAPLTTIQEGDVVVCFNFRTDRGREITIALTQKAFPEFGMEPLKLHYITMTAYDDTFDAVNVVFHKDNLTNTIGEVLAAHGRTQTRIAETEKYPHVTFFFSGGREQEFKGESRILIPSPKVATYDLQPEMSAQGVADAICEEINTRTPDFICLNFANPDMVGHTGVFSAVVKAVETVDRCTRQVVECGERAGYSFIIIADHGNAEFMINEDGSVNTAHTTNLVPCILIDKDLTAIADGKLGDIAPTILKMMGVPIPAEMTGNILV